MDVALTLHHLVPAAGYCGSLTGNDEASYAALDWADARAKPTWAQLELAEAAARAAYEASVPVSKAAIAARVIDQGQAAAFLAAINADPVMALRWSTQPTFLSGDADLRALMAGCGVDADAALAV